RAVGDERAVGVDRLHVPAVDPLVSPWADARGDDQVHPAGVITGVALQELQRAVDATGFVTVDATGDQHRRQLVVPLAALERHQRVMVGAVVQLAVLADVEPVAQALHHGQHVVAVAALDLLAGAPGVALCVAPGRAGGADRIEGGDVAHGWGSRLNAGADDGAHAGIRQPRRARFTAMANDPRRRPACLRPAAAPRAGGTVPRCRARGRPARWPG